MALALAGVLGVGIVAAACSLSDVKRANCTSDAQCAGAFGMGSTCQGGYCTDPTGGPMCNPAQTDSMGRPCYGCPPMTQAQFHTACTDVMCQPFDNAHRLTNLAPDGGLPPLPQGDAG
jgi:hypothetical protein